MPALRTTAGRGRRRPAVLAVAIMASVALAASGCGDDAPPSAARSSAASSPAPASSVAPPATVEGLEDELPPADASFPASTADDGGEQRAGSAPDEPEDMQITGLRLLPQNGYDRLVVDLNTAAIPHWTARYTGSPTAAGDPVDVAGDSFLRIGLLTENSSADPLPVVVGESGVVVEVRSTGSVGGYQEVLVGVRGPAAPFRTFGLTDPGRIVVDIRPAG